MLVFEKVEGIIANCSNSYHFVIRDTTTRWPRVPHAGSRIEWSGPFSRMDTVHSHSRPAHARGEMAAKTECAKAQLQWRDQSDCAEPRREILRQCASAV